jgi:hypothetical protein
MIKKKKWKAVGIQSSRLEERACRDGNSSHSAYFENNGLCDISLECTLKARVSSNQQQADPPRFHRVASGEQATSVASFHCFAHFQSCRGQDNCGEAARVASRPGDTLKNPSLLKVNISKTSFSAFRK